MRIRRIIRGICGPILIAALFLVDISGDVQKNDPAQINPAQSTTGPLPPPSLDRTGHVFSASGAATATVISGVPSYLWRYGCGPTALGIVVGYYDSHGYPNLIPGDANTQGINVNSAIASQGNYDDYCLPIDYYPNLLPDKSAVPLGDEHTDNCLADFMKSSQSHYGNYYGWSWNYHVGPSFENYTASCSNYHGTSSMTSFSNFSWSWVQEEINNNRPLVFLVDSDGNGSTDHFITVIGYNTESGLNYYGCYDTWDNNVHWYEYRAMANGSPWGVFSINTFSIATHSVSLTMHCVGDFDGDGLDEAAIDFGTFGIWEWNAGSWSQIRPENSEGMLALDIDGDGAKETAADLGPSGLWLWDSGTWAQLDPNDPEYMIAVDTNNNQQEELILDLGPQGLKWRQEDGSMFGMTSFNAQDMIAADADGDQGDEVIADFGVAGVWTCDLGDWARWTPADPNSMVRADVDNDGRDDVAFGLAGFGTWLWNDGVWLQLSGLLPEGLASRKVGASGMEQVVGDYGSIGLWLLDGSNWIQLTGVNPGQMLQADVDADGDGEIVVDFGTLGLWLWDSGVWSGLTGFNPENVLSGDVDGDNKKELLIDFGTSGVWLWNEGVWSQLTGANPD